MASEPLVLGTRGSWALRPLPATLAREAPDQYTVKVTHQRLMRQHTQSRNHGIGSQATQTPRNLNDSAAPFARLTLATIGALKSEQGLAARNELWDAPAATILGTLNVIRRSMSCRSRRRGPDYLLGILESRNGNWCRP